MNLELARASIREGNADEALAALRPDYEVYAHARLYSLHLQERNGLGRPQAIAQAVRRFARYVDNPTTLQKQVRSPNGNVAKLVTILKSRFADSQQSTD